jgi:hypothetical protein
MDVRLVIPRDPAEFNIAAASEPLQLWQVRLSHQDKRHVRKVLVRMEINMSMAETGCFCDGVFLDKAHRKPFTPLSDRSQVVGELIHADVNGPMSVKSLRSAE